MRRGYLFLFAILCMGTPAIAATLSVVAGNDLADPAQHGLSAFETALKTQGWDVENVDSAEAAHGDVIAFAEMGDQLKSLPFAPALAHPLDVPESLAVRKFSLHGKPAILFTAADSRGLMYALLDAAQSIGGAKSPAELTTSVREIEERPTVRDRALSVYTMNRAYWESRFYDERYWSRYFDMLAADRFNRFIIIFGYENGGFLAPPYPYFFNTPGFDSVRMTDLTADQQQRNLAAINHLIELAHARGISVTLGIWDHIYRGGVQAGGAEWVNDYKDRPVPNTVQGVSEENLYDYTLASLRELVAKVPAVDSFQFRVHEESGLKKDQLESFWRAVFTDMRKTKPGMKFELRGKGTPDVVIDTAIENGFAVRMETKFWMEQMGLPFHPIHVNPQDQNNRRHGYADFLHYPQKYEMTWRLWNGGTSRVLLWGDPDYVRRYVASTSLYDSPNFDVQEPLATKMEAQRPEMKPFDLMPEKYRYYDYEFERYWHFYELWGRLGYNPQTSPDVWQREFHARFGPAAPDVEQALNAASEILPHIVASVAPYSIFPTTRGWAERQSLGASLAQYAKNETTDVELFESFANAAQRILDGGSTAKVTPDATSRWFNAAADAVLAHVKAAESTVGDKRGKEFDSTITDLKILAQLARFHARRSLAAVHYNLYLRSQNKAELSAAVAGEKDAISAWSELVDIAGDRYAFDLAMGARNSDLCGHWRDELAKLKANLDKLESQAGSPTASSTQPAVWSPPDADPSVPIVDADRTVSAQAGKPLRIVAHISDSTGVKSVRLHYRHVTQYENYLTLDMQPTGSADEYAATIPGEFLTPNWDAMYFIEAINKPGNGTLWPDYRREAPYVFVKLQR